MLVPPLALLLLPTPAAAILDLTPAQLGPQPVAHVVGVVTFVRHDNKVIYVQDDTAGLCVPVDAGTAVPAGTRVEVFGRACAGYWCPVLAAESVVPLGPAPPPDPAPFDLSEETVRRLYGQYVGVRGLVAAADTWEDYARLVVRGPAGTVDVLIPGPERAAELQPLVGAVVRARGVMAFPVVDDGKPNGRPRVFATDPSKVTVLRTAEAVRGKQPRPLADLKRVTPGPDVGGWLVRAQGVVTASPTDGRTLYLADADAAVAVELADPAQVPVGERVEVIGTADPRGAFVTVRQATVRPLGLGPSPAPRDVPAEALADAAAAFALVRVEGTVASAEPRPVGTVVRAIAGGTEFVAVLPPGDAAPDLPPGTRVAVVGVNTAGERSGLPVVRLRRAADLEVLDRPPPAPWLTPARAAYAAGGVVGVLLLAAGWTVLLKRQVRRRTVALQESEAKFATAFNASPDAILITRRSDGAVVEVNDGFTRATGFSRESVVGRPTAGFGWADPADRGKMLAELAARGRLRDYPAAVSDAAGRPRRIVLSAEPVRVNGDDCLLAVTRDVTAEVESRAALERSERKFSLMFHANPLGMLIARVADGRVLEVNAAYCRLSGWSRDDLLGRSTLDVGLWDDPADREAMYAELRADGRVTDRDVRVRRCGGELREWVLSIDLIDVDGQACAVGAATDVTDRRRAERALAASERKFSLLFHASPLGTMISRVSDGKMYEFNPAFCALVGRPRAELLGRSAVDIGLWTDPVERAAVAAELREHGRVIDRDVRLRTAAGDVREVRLSIEAIDVDGEACAIGVANDVTDRRRADRERAAADRRFAQTFHASPLGLVICRLTDGRVLDLNPAFARLVGRPRDELLGRTTADAGLWADPGDQPAVNAVLEGGGRLAGRDVRVRTPAGDVRECVLSAEPVEMDGVPCAVAAMDDVTDRRRAEGALAASERKFAALFESSPVGMVLSRFADGTVLAVNRGYEQMMGYDRAELVGRTSVAAGLLDSAAERDRLVARLREAGRLPATEFVRRRKDGTEVVHSTSAELVVVDGDELLIVCAIDVTARVRAERERAAADRKFAAVFEASPVCMVVSRFADGTILEANRGFEQMFGYARDEVVGRTSVALGLIDDGATREALAAAVRRDGRLPVRESTRRRKDGTEVTNLSSVELVTVDGEELLVVCAIDVTARVRAERTFRTLFEMCPVALGVSALDGTYRDVNRAFLDMHQRTRADLIGRKSTDVPGMFNSPDERAGLLARFLRDGRACDVEQSRVRPDGSRLDTVSSAEPIDLDGVPHVLAATVDVTALKQAQAALTEANAGLERRVAARTAELVGLNAELEAFCYSVSHDLRSPLRAIAGFSQAVDEDYADKLDADGRDYLARIRAAAKRMGELIDDLLSLSRVSRADMARRQVDVSALARSVAAAIAEADPGRAVEWAIAPDMAADADPNLLRVVYDNLLSNAWKYTGKNPTARIEVGCEHSDGGAVYYVRDDGVGFDPKYAHKLFQPFQRLHRADEFDGHGIGLATVRRVVARHGGTTRAAGDLGRGATFSFTLGTPDGGTG